MYSAPEGYAEAAQSTDRVETVYMSLGINIDNTAADDITAYTGDSLPMSSGPQLVDATYEIDHSLATYEGDGIVTASSANTTVPSIQPDSNVRAGWWSSALSDADGYIDSPLTITLSQAHTSAVTIYTDGPSIVAGSVIFSLNNVETEVALDCHEYYAVANGDHTYDKITIEITQIAEPYRHLRLAEIEFGDSVTISTATLGHEITYIDEIDPLQQGLPIRELDFDLINVNGEYDEDNPDSLFSRLAIGNPINLSYTIMGNGRKFTIPMGRFILAEKRASGNCITVVAYDPRWYLSQMYNEWSLSTSQSIGATLDALLTSVEIAHTIEAGVDSIMPVSAYAFDSETTLLDDIQMVAQAYGLTVIPNRIGTLVIGTDFPSDDYGELPPQIQFGWPETSQMNRYNYIDVVYGSGSHYTRDLRGGATVARSVLSVNNRLITTQAQAEAVCNRIVGRLYTKAMTVEWASDPVIDIGDTIDVFSMWTLNNTPATFKTVKREIIYNGMLKETTTLLQ